MAPPTPPDIVLRPGTPRPPPPDAPLRGPRVSMAVMAWHPRERAALADALERGRPRRPDAVRGVAHRAPGRPRRAARARHAHRSGHRGARAVGADRPGHSGPRRPGGRPGRLRPAGLGRARGPAALVPAALGGGRGAAPRALRPHRGRAPRGRTGPPRRGSWPPRRTTRCGAGWCASRRGCTAAGSPRPASCSRPRAGRAGGQAPVRRGRHGHHQRWRRRARAARVRPHPAAQVGVDGPPAAVERMLADVRRV